MGLATVGGANAARSPDTELRRRVSAAPTTPPTTPMPMNPRAAREDRRVEPAGCPAVSALAVSSGAADFTTRLDVRNRSVAMPHTAPTSVGMTSTSDAFGRDSTAAQPATAASAMTMLPTGTRVRSHCPAMAATTAMTTSTMTVRNSLSLVPKVWIAHSLTGPGVRSMTEEPIALRASAVGPNGTATSAPTPTAIAAAAIPGRAPGRVGVSASRGDSTVWAMPPRYPLHRRDLLTRT